MIGGILSYLRSDAQSADVVPRSGITAQLLVLSAAAMAFLAVFALALSLATARLAERWENDLAQSATIRIVAAPAERVVLTETTLRILESTAGVAFARVLSAEEQQALLAPWFGSDLDLSELPVPQLIEVVQDDAGFDAEGLRLRLEAEVPGAVLDDHETWRAPLVTSANRLRSLGLVSIVLLGGMLTAMVTLAANVSLATNGQVIRVLRLVGGTDRFIARAFVRRFTLRALGGAFAGTLAGLAAVALLPPASDTAGFLTGLGFQGAQWAFPLLIPLFSAGIAFAATGWAARRVLRELA